MSISYNKREVAKKKQQKKKDKQRRKDERKAQGTSSFEDMIAYVDAYGNLCDTAPEARPEEVEAQNISISVPKRTPLTQTGRVQYYSADKGYGFITDEASADKYFFHISDAPASVTEGQRVSFEVNQTPRGLTAVSIALLSQ